jgi:MFS family permease
LIGGGRVLVGTSLLWIALSAVSDGVATLVMPVRLGANGTAGTAGALGLMTVVGLLAGMLVQPLIGSLSDRLRPRVGRLVFLGLGVLLVVVALTALAAADQPLTIGLTFMALSVALGVAQAPQQALMADLVPHAQRGRASGLKGLADLLGAMLGFAVLGSLLAGGDVRPALVALALTIIALFVVVIVLLSRARGTPSAEPPPAWTLRQTFTLDPSRDRPFLVAVGARFCFLLGTYAVGRFFVAFIADRRGLEAGPAAEAAGGILALLALATAVASLPAGLLSDRYRRTGLMVAGAAVSAIGIGTLGAAATESQIVVGGIAMAVGSALFGVANWATLVDLAPPAEAGRYLGLANVGTAGAAAAAGLFGPLIDAGQEAAPGAGFVLLFGAAVAASLAAAGLAAVIHPPALPIVGSEPLSLEGSVHERP